MNDKLFLDTNIIIYAHSDHDIIKQGKAQSIIINQRTIISTQVLQEAANVFKKKLNQSYTDISKVLTDLVANHQLHINNSDTILKACDISLKYGFSFFDSVIIPSALESGANILYSEDMHHEFVIEGRLKIINPFK